MQWTDQSQLTLWPFIRLIFLHAVLIFLTHDLAMGIFFCFIWIPVQILKTMLWTNKGNESTLLKYFVCSITKNNPKLKFGVCLGKMSEFIIMFMVCFNSANTKEIKENLWRWYSFFDSRFFSRYNFSVIRVKIRKRLISE